MQDTPFISADLLAAGRRIILEEQLASIALLQRHLRLGFGFATALMRALEQQGIVEDSGEGHFRLSDRVQDGSAGFRSWALGRHSGCDGGDGQGAVWVLGVEHGNSPNEGSGPDAAHDGNPIARQRTYRYNVQVFKLLAAIAGMAVQDWRGFAEREQPFVKGQRGYFKGNLYPYPCWNDLLWDAEARRETGFQSKDTYRAWCRHHRFPVLSAWIGQAAPTLIIGTGIMRVQDFVDVAFEQAPVTRQNHFVEVAGRRSRFVAVQSNGRLLVVVPHLSGSRLFAADATLQAAGTMIAGMWEAARTPQG